MLYETLSQPLILLYVIVVGFLSGVVFDIATFLLTIFKQNKFLRHLLDFICTSVVCGIFFLLIFNLNYGEIRLWQVVCFVVSVVIERLSIGKLVAKGLLVCYTFFIKKLKKVKAKK